MKLSLLKQFLFLPILITLLVGCKNEYETIFEESADDRIRKVLEEKRSQLLDAENGWTGVIETGLDLNFVFYFDFQEDGSVIMISDFDTTTAGVPMNGTYVLKALQRPTLSFDTYSYVSLLTDPDASVNGGIYGEGLYSDIEFAFDSETEGDLIMEGIQRNTKMTMVKATAQEKAAFLGGDLKESLINSYDYLENNYYSSIDIGGGVVLYVGFNLSTKIFTVFYLNENAEFEQSSASFIYSPVGLILRNPISVAGVSFDELIWDDNSNTYYITVNGSQFSFVGSNDPIIPAINPPLIDVLGDVYSQIDINPSNISRMSPGFLSRFQNVYNQLSLIYGVDLTNVIISFNPSGTQALITYELHVDNQVFFLDYLCNVTYNAGSTISFTITSNPRVIDQYVEPLNEYFESFSFQLDYVPDASAGSLLARLYPLENDDFCFGVLGE